MVSVTQEALAGMSFQPTSARSGRPDSDPPPGNDSFAALVDSNTTASSDSRADDPAPAAPRRNDDPPPAADPPRDASAAPERPARNDSEEGRDDPGSGGRADRPDRSDATADTSKSDAPKSSKPSKPSKGDKAKDDDSSKQHGTAATTVIAATMAAANAPATAPAATPNSGTATAPLATAAAAIAAAASITGTTADATAKAAATKTDIQGVAADAGNAQATGVALTAAVAKPQAKTATQSKPTLTSKDAIATAGDQDGTTDAATSAAPTGIVPDIAAPEAVAGKHKADSALIDAVKSDTSGNQPQTPAANAANQAQAGAANAAPNFAATFDNSAQAAGMIQPQLQPTATTPAAASQLTVTAATPDKTVPVSGLAMEIAASANSGKSRFDIRLDPAELGRIDVRIHIDSSGQVTSHLTVERPETLQMLRQDANQLQRALDNAGLSTGNGGLQFSLRDQSSSGQNGGQQQSNPNAHRLIVSEEDSVPAPVAGRGYGRMLGASGGVDIRI